VPSTPDEELVEVVAAGLHPRVRSEGEWLALHVDERNSH